VSADVLVGNDDESEDDLVDGRRLGGSKRHWPESELDVERSHPRAKRFAYDMDPDDEDEDEEEGVDDD